jgi:hypothetical protein
MGKKKSLLTDALDTAKNSTKNNSQIDIWLAKGSGREGQLKEALEWFFENRDSHFGWQALYDTLIALEGWDEFPVGVKALQAYVSKHGLDPGVNNAD